MGCPPTYWVTAVEETARRRALLVPIAPPERAGSGTDATPSGESENIILQATHVRHRPSRLVLRLPRSQGFTQCTYFVFKERQHAARSPTPCDRSRQPGRRRDRARATDPDYMIRCYRILPTWQPAITTKVVSRTGPRVAQHGVARH